MMIFSLSPVGLQSMLDTCHRNTTEDRYRYNATKCRVIVYNESRTDYKLSQRRWTMGESEVSESTTYTHLGVPCGTYHQLVAENANPKETQSPFRGILSLVENKRHLKNRHSLLYHWNSTRVLHIFFLASYLYFIPFRMPQSLRISPQKKSKPHFLYVPKETLFQGKLSLIANEIVALYYTPGIGPGCYSFLTS